MKEILNHLERKLADSAVASQFRNDIREVSILSLEDSAL